MKKIILIYTRNLSQWVNQMLRDEYVKHFPKVWGRGLRDQIGHYTGKGIEIYRYVDDNEKLKNYMVNKDIKDHIFRKETHKQFCRDVDTLRRLISKQPKLKDEGEHLKKIEEYFSKMYPFYTLAVFLPGAWREDFIKKHVRQAGRVLEIVKESRKYSEGLLKECDLYLRRLVRSKLERLDLPKEYAKILSVRETRKFIDKNQLPNRKVLDRRLKEYVYIDGVINVIDNFEVFLRQRSLKIKRDLILGGKLLGGVVACKGVRKNKIIMGIVKTIFHRNEVSSFKKGNILVSNMTAPEYLPAVKKARAIITDEGGLTCHAAIVSRELGIPCVIATKIATEVLKDGDMVEVDATKGVVRKIQ